MCFAIEFSDEKTISNFLYITNIIITLFHLKVFELSPVKTIFKLNNMDDIFSRNNNNNNKII